MREMAWGSQGSGRPGAHPGPRRDSAWSLGGPWKESDAVSLSQLLADLAQRPTLVITTVCLGPVFGTVCLILAACVGGKSDIGLESTLKVRGM